MRRNAAFIVLGISEILVFSLALLMYFKARKNILEAFAEFGTELPWSCRITLSSWFLPGAMGAAALLSLVALVFPFGRGQRTAIVALGLVLSAAALVAAVWSAFEPMFRAA